jgi:hypothetical protein
MITQLNLGTLCPYASNCQVYSGEEKVEGSPVFLIKNVFCNRGGRGWKNCKWFKTMKDEEVATLSTSKH